MTSRSCLNVTTRSAMSVHKQISHPLASDAVHTQVRITSPGTRIIEITQNR
ncbi:hypothetical protein AB0B45_32050 [Nonomuraea sp. NPDC049152]|uniref:hypothetical protein n=1 Tax=Nonomuraea sp. NPDC049152 TaxID=3154350 RepID=UPI003401A3D6